MLARSVAQAPTELQAARRAEHRQHLSLCLMRQVWHLLGKRNRTVPLGDLMGIGPTGALVQGERPGDLARMGPAPVVVVQVEEEEVQGLPHPPDLTGDSGRVALSPDPVVIAARISAPLVEVEGTVENVCMVVDPAS